jgi:hypothetical protein
MLFYSIRDICATEIPGYSKTKKNEIENNNKEDATDRFEV